MDSMSASPRNHKSDSKLFWIGRFRRDCQNRRNIKTVEIENLHGRARSGEDEPICRLLLHKSQLLNG
jgi:hypothetical protein